MSTDGGWQVLGYTNDGTTWKEPPPPVPDGDRAGFPRPRGVDRTGDPMLTLDGDALDVIMMIVYSGYRLTGYAQAPIAKALDDRRQNPHPGDLVMVPDSMSRRATCDDRRHGWGYLLAVRHEPMFTDEDWLRIVTEEDPEYGPRPIEKVFYIQYGPNPQDVCRWENASVMAVPHTQQIADEIQADAARFL